MIGLFGEWPWGIPPPIRVPPQLRASAWGGIPVLGGALFWGRWFPPEQGTPRGGRDRLSFFPLDRLAFLIFFSVGGHPLGGCGELVRFTGRLAFPVLFILQYPHHPRG